MERYDEKRLLAVQTVEALRAGVPTRNSTRQLPDLRKNITDCIRTDLATFAEGLFPRGRMIWGQYGQGKTHVLTVAEHLALDMGFAVSMVSLSREVSCHNLFHFYGRVAPRIRTPDSTMLGLARALARQTSDAFANNPLNDRERYVHPLPALVLEDYFWASGEEQDQLYADLTGIRLPATELRRIHRLCRKTSLRKFSCPFKVTEHASAYFGVMADAIRLCGYKGWVILIDEVELTGRLGSVSRMKAYRNLHWLLNWSGMMPYPIYTLAATATRLQDDTWYGGGKDDRNVMPRMATERLGEEAGRDLGTFFERAIGKESLVVTPVMSEDLFAMLDCLTELHGLAYNWDSVLDTRQLVHEIGAQPMRTYVRAAMEALDVQYVYNERAALTATDLTEAKLDADPDFWDHAAIDAE